VVRVNGGRVGGLILIFMGTKPTPKNETLLERRPCRKWVLLT